MHLCLTTDGAAAMSTDTRVHLENGGRGEPDCGDFPRSALADREDVELLRCRDPTDISAPFKFRRYGPRLGGVKVRHKRQVLQDMARPLKHWLYKHRDNPYPTKTEKVLLALGSHMTLVQVSNWFANARRRLKNTVRQPDLSWALRIKLYNKYIQGNAERLSVCSDDTDSDGRVLPKPPDPLLGRYGSSVSLDEECPVQAAMGQSDFGRSPHQSVLQKQDSVLAMADSGSSEDGASPPSKYKSSLLNRYLNDTLRHMMAAEASASPSARKRRSHSESFSSSEDRDVVSPASSYETEANFVYQMDTTDYSSIQCDRERQQQRRVHQGWREIHAAVALTNLAQGPSCTPGQSGLGQRRVREPFAITRSALLDRMCVTGPTAVRQSCVARPALASRIIQKSSHISEVQTVNVALASGVSAPSLRAELILP